MGACLKISAAAAAPSEERWLELAEAAQRLGKTERRVRQMCGAWQAHGLARKISAEAGKARWQIAQSALLSSPIEQSPEFRPDVLSAGARKQLLERKRILDDLESAHARGIREGKTSETILSQFIQELELREGMKLSARTLRRWRMATQQSGLAGLVDGRANRSATAEAQDSDFMAYVKRLYLQLSRPKLTNCFELASLKAQEMGWLVLSFKKVQRLIAALPRQLVVKMREGEKAYNDQCEPPIERDYSGLESNQIWCGDHHQFDVMVLHEGKHTRPWITAWEDLRSRKLVGWKIFAHDPNADTILASFVAGAMEHGLPKTVQIDNGKDYDSRSLQGITKAQSDCVKCQA